MMVSRRFITDIVGAIDCRFEEGRGIILCRLLLTLSALFNPEIPKIDSRRFGFILQLDTEETSFNE